MATTRKADPKRRSGRVAARIQSELATALAQDFNDPRLQGVVISAVRVTDDLSLARVGVLMLGDDPEGKRLKAAVARLEALSSAVRAALAPKLEMRRVPNFRFEAAAVRAEADSLEALLHEVGQELSRKGE